MCTLIVCVFASVQPNQQTKQTHRKQTKKTMKNYRYQKNQKKTYKNFLKNAQVLLAGCFFKGNVSSILKENKSLRDVFAKSKPFSLSF